MILQWLGHGCVQLPKLRLTVKLQRSTSLSIALVTVRYQGLARTDVTGVGMFPDNVVVQVFGAISD
jgi:hypothetical protein